MPQYHAVVGKLQSAGKLKCAPTSNTDPQGMLSDRKVIYTNEQLYSTMADSRVMVCFPRSDTNPREFGAVETLTQRYWEAMLCRCVMVGRAPRELIDLVGYNPVTEVDWQRPTEQLADIIAHIADYQALVDRNRQTAEHHAPWSARMTLIMQCLREAGYRL